MMNISLHAGSPPVAPLERSGNVHQIHETKIGEHGFEKQKMEDAPKKSTFREYGFEKYPDQKQRVQVRKRLH